MSRARSAASSWSLPFGGWLPSARALISVQHRNMMALTRVSASLTDTALQVANKQAEFIQAVADAARTNPLSAGAPASSADAVKMQAEAGRELLNRAIRETREITDITRDCWSEIVQEVQACASENLNGLQDSLRTESNPLSKERHEGTVSRSPSVTEPRTKAATA